MLWDAGGSFEVDSPVPWQDQTVIEIIMIASRGLVNVLAESTTDPNAPTQSTSTFLWHRNGSVVQDTTLEFIWNGSYAFLLWSASTISTPKQGRNLVQGTDYEVVGTNITFKVTYVSTLFQPTSTPGFKGNITLLFTGGAVLHLQAYQWAAPTLASSSSTITNAAAQNDLAIPVSWQGKPQLATVKAQMVNGSYLVDTWTQYLGPLQQGRMVFTLFSLSNSLISPAL
jgi:endoglucanase